MLHNVYLYRGATRVIVASSIVFIVLNVIENIIHYNIGRSTSSDRPKGDGATALLHLPNVRDTVRIVVVMVVFALLQGVFTYWFSTR